VIRNTPDRFGENTSMEPVDGAQRRSRGNGLRECLLMALALYSLAPGEASAGDRPQSANSRSDAGTQKTARMPIAAPSFAAPSFVARSFPAPFAFSAPPESQAFSPTEFRPRKPGLLDAAVSGNEASFIDAPMLRDNSIARELREARTQDRVRLLTLWQSRASSLSLQAGKHGAPSLQWSTPWMHHDTTSRGLFDRLLPTSPRSFGSAFRGGVSHQSGPIAPAKSLDLGAPVNK
jgi:hypothetical protein